MTYSVNQWRWAILKVMIDAKNKPMLEAEMLDKAYILLAGCSDDMLIEAEKRGAETRKLANE